VSVNTNALPDPVAEGTDSLEPQDVPDPAVAVALAPPIPKVNLFKRLLKNPMGLFALTILAVIVVSAILAPILAPADPNLASLQNVRVDPGQNGFFLGTDGAGRDVWSRLLTAGRYSLAGALLAVAVAAVLGITNGLIAGYYAGWFDTVSSWIVSLIMALPGIVVLLAARAVVGPGLWTSMAIFGVLLSPGFFRLTYTAVTGVRNELYVDAARVAGLSDVSIIGKHILTVVRAPVIIQSAQVMSIAVAIQSGLDFLGLGDLAIPTWGGMLNDGFQNIYLKPILILWPSLAIGLTAVGNVLLANAMRDELERSGQPPKRKGKQGETGLSREEIITHAEPITDKHLGDVLLVVDNVSIGYQQSDGSIKHVVEDVNLTVRRGEVHGLIGESGSGKTQTAFSVMQLLPQGGEVTGGSILFEGEEIAHATEAQMMKLRGTKIAYIPQEPMSNLDPSFTIGSQLTEPMMLGQKLSKADAKAKALKLLARVGIPNPERTFNSYPHQVSGGMAQRVLIAGAVSMEPDLLIADEPTTALDVTVQAEVLDLLRELQAEYNMGVILVTHNFGVVADLCDRVSVMRNGRIVETGNAASIFVDPRHEYTRMLFDAILDENSVREDYAHAGTTAAATEGSQK
jgi:ABC-type dipeptide/oligopeptide/nickel transport system ATPase component/ABC-type dipeptide/oligopeptide/nickel transport system permease subunit